MIGLLSYSSRCLAALSAAAVLMTSGPRADADGPIAEGAAWSVAFAPFKACHPDDDGHREILNWYLTDSEFLADRITHGTDGIAMPQIQVVENTDSACAALDSFFATSMAKTYEGTSDKFYQFTYYKAGEFLFVSRSIKLSPDPNRFSSGISTFSVHDSTGAFIKGYAF